MSVTQELLQSAQQLPQGMESPGEFVAIAVATGVAMIAMRGRFNRTHDDYAAEFPNPELLEASIKPDETKNRRTRLSGSMLEIAGAGLAIASLVGQPTYETNHSFDQRNVVAIQDVSTSMRRTQDLGTPHVTRNHAVTSAIKHIKYTGDLGVIQVAASDKVVIPLSKHWRKHDHMLSKPHVDTNGGNLVPAIELAASLLPPAEADGKQEGTVVIISDGTVDDTPNALSAEAAKLKNEGLKVKVVLPGTSGSTYRFTPTSPAVPSGVQPGNFSGFGAANITQAPTVKAVNEAVAQAISDSGSEKQDHTWYPALAVGLIMFGVGFIKDKLQRSSRKV